MANTPEGTKMVAAKRIGITLEAYLQHQGAGEKWCSKFDILPTAKAGGF